MVKTEMKKRAGNEEMMRCVAYPEGLTPVLNGCRNQAYWEPMHLSMARELESHVDYSTAQQHHV